MTAVISRSGAPVYRAPPVPWVAGCTMPPPAGPTPQVRPLQTPCPPPRRTEVPPASYVGTKWLDSA